MNTSETIAAIVSGAVVIETGLGVLRQAIKNPWIRCSVSASFAVLPPDKRTPKVPPQSTAALAAEPPASAAVPAGANGAAG